LKKISAPRFAKNQENRASDFLHLSLQSLSLLSVTSENVHPFVSLTSPDARRWAAGYKQQRF
jgi:hypothetical protein